MFFNSFILVINSKLKNIKHKTIVIIGCKMLSIPDYLKNLVKVTQTNYSINNVLFYVNTYSVVPTRDNGYFLDDNTYIKYPELIDLIPRGFSILSVDDIEICRLDGIQKFGGTTPLDEDCEYNNTCYSLPDAGSIKVEFLEKVNGKMAIFKILKYSGKYYIFGGSKNKHVIVDFDNEIDNDELHYKMIEVFKNDIKNTKNIDEYVNQTVIAEYMDGKHIVYTEQPYIVYFYGPNKNVKNILPEQNCFPTQEQLMIIRNMENIEGVVITYTDTNTGKIYRQKHKTVWYIMLRVMRESIKKYKSRDHPDIIIRDVYEIFKKRSCDFLNLSEDVLNIWKGILKDFVYFMINNGYDYSELDYTKTGFALIFNEFINNEYESSLLEPRLVAYIKSLYKNSNKFCVIMRGAPGSGKSSVVKSLGNIVTTFSTDDLFIKNGIYTHDRNELSKNHKINFKNFSEALGKIQGICVDNTSINYQDYIKYINSAVDNGYITIILQCKKLDPNLLFSRNIHGVSLEIITKYLKMYEYVSPRYYGIFFRYEDILQILEGYTPKQKTPLHNTLFYGKDEINSEKCMNVSVGSLHSVHVISLCENNAGIYLRTTTNIHKNGHITLESFPGYTPVEINNSPPKNEKYINKKICGIYGPIY